MSDRGISLFNPGLLRDGRRAWQGLSTPRSDPAGYLIFESAAFGLAALAADIGGKYHDEGLHTVAALVRKSTPPDDGSPVEAYVRAVASELRLGPGELFDLDETRWGQLMRAIIRYQNGRVPYTSTQIAQAVLAARQGRG